MFEQTLEQMLNVSKSGQRHEPLTVYSSEENNEWHGKLGIGGKLGILILWNSCF